MKIIDVNFDKLNRVVHLADIHIRLFKRHAEYKRSFRKLYRELKQLDLDQGVIVVAGDILHAKLDMSPEMVALTSDFLTNLAKIAPTLIIDGNHDLNLSNPHRMNSLYPIINNIDHPDLHYLPESGVYRVADTEFAVFSIIDAYSNPENWPNVEDMTAKTKIAMYHGPVYGAKTDTNYMISSRHVEVGRFDGFDAVMLGDIHTHQVMQRRNKSQKKPIIAYASSLIQQNHGEKLFGHGYNVWELPSCKMQFCELQSDTGYVTLEIKSEDLNKLVIPDNLPKNLRLRLFASNIENTKLKKIIAVIRKKYKLLDININPSKLDPQTLTSQAERFDTGDLSDVNVQNSLIQDWILSNYPMISEETIESVVEINKRVNGLINYSDQSRNIHWKPLKFEFSNLFSFGENNVIDFTNMSGTNGIFAPNASGKSSSMEALSFCLFDKTPRAFRGDHIMNIRKKSFDCKLAFDVNGEVYVIKRTGKKNKKGAVRVDVEFWKEHDDGTKTILNGEDRFDTNASIRSIVGTYEDFILTTLSGQHGNSLFIDKSNSERKVLLNQFMGLNIFEQLERVANEESKELYGVLKKFSREDFTEQLVSLQNDIETHNIELLEVQTEIDDFDREIEGLQVEMETLSSERIKLPVTNMDRSSLVKSKKSFIKKKDQIEKNIDDAYGDLDSDKRDDFAITLQNVGTFLEDEIDYDDLSQEDRDKFDEIFDDIEEQVRHLQNDELGMGSIEGDPREVSKRAVEFIKKFSTKNEGIIKLKSLLSEEVLNENMVSVLKPPVRKAKSTIYGYNNLQYHAVPLIKSMREFLKLVSKIDIVGIDFDDREDITPIWDLGHWRAPFIKEPVSVLIKKLERALKNPKNFNEPERVDYSVPKRLGSVLFPKYRQVVNAYKRFDKFNNQKVSDVFRDTKGKRIGNRLIGDFGGFNLLQDVKKLLNDEGGFQLRDSLPDILKDIEYKASRKRGKKIVQGANE